MVAESPPRISSNRVKNGTSDARAVRNTLLLASKKSKSKLPSRRFRQIAKNAPLRFTFSASRQRERDRYLLSGTLSRCPHTAVFPCDKLVKFLEVLALLQCAQPKEACRPLEPPVYPVFTRAAYGFGDHLRYLFIAPLGARCIQSVNYKEGGVAMGEEKQSTGFGFEASEVPELERKEFITKVLALIGVSSV